MLVVFQYMDQTVLKRTISRCPSGSPIRCCSQSVNLWSSAASESLARRKRRARQRRNNFTIHQQYQRILWSVALNLLVMAIHDRLLRLTKGNHAAIGTPVQPSASASSSLVRPSPHGQNQRGMTHPA
ncbi:hypothetical protein KCP78_24050 [Salmonella enterica subsp. enterica]|nr:hypothetical protein KCP78_24050 [Salmonella enterica subsp. enterica]